MLNLLLSVTADSHGDVSIIDDRTDFPLAEDEGAVLDNGSDVLVTVKGNAKFAGKRFIELALSVTKQLLGQRILFAREDKLSDFSSVDDITGKTVGVPETWVDAELFRRNGFNVVERGNFDGLFQRLTDGEFDFVCFGANEALEVFESRVANQYPVSLVGGVMIEYPFPLVFYVNADNPELAKRLQLGCEIVLETGDYEALYQRYFADIERTLKLEQRERLELNNPFI
ncbi:transporter substrate-binding domain-containing protein [Vibrio sp. 10N]|nr:transporter substrate-binding domain-containing protein [Vibrio sp. 10N]